MFSNKSSACNYILFPTFFKNNLPKSIFHNIEKNNLGKFGCPSVNSLKDRVYNVNSYFTIEIEYGIKDNEPYYEYTLDKKTTTLTNRVHDLLNEVLQVSYVNNIINLQLLSPYAFVTDDKDLEVITTTPNMKTENSIYVSGSLKPYSWVRNLNSAWTLKNNKKPGKLYFNLADPFLSFIFNKNVDLQYMETNEKILNYINQSLEIVTLRQNLSKIYKTALSRRPKNLL